MQPRSRSVRAALNTKDALEKERLRHRSGAYFRYEDIRNPIDVQHGCPSHMKNKERMTAGPCCEEVNYGEREVRRYLKDEITEVRRERQLNREDSRWRAISAQNDAGQRRVERMQADPLMGRKNYAGQPYNAVNQTYDATPAGAQLKFHDDCVKYRSKVREATMAVRNHLGFNPIIGEQTHQVSIPPPPRPPSLALA